MGFASGWLKSGVLFPALIDEAPDADTGIIVVVPSFDEPSVTELLDSVSLCKPPLCKTEIIIIINASLEASPASLKNNLETYSEIETWRDNNQGSFFRLFALNIGQPDIKRWGVGLARKAGMDEALRRFNIIDKPDGVIVNLDADCTVAENYFVSIENELLTKKNRTGCSIYFEHSVSGEKFPASVYNAAFQYELHLRYYFQALSYTGFPHVFHTVGSSIAVKSLPYLKAGGMNRRQAGEDFYFVQKLVPQGGYFNLVSTTVYPSPRASGRVPFGTGATVGKMVAVNQEQLFTYNPLAFKDLRIYFGEIERLYHSKPTEFYRLFLDLPESLRAFLDDKQFIAKISEIKNNTSGMVSFRKRFFGWFNMFKVVKYLNFTHKSHFRKVPVIVAAEELLRYKKTDGDTEIKNGLLEYYRCLEKNRG